MFITDYQINTLVEFTRGQNYFYSILHLRLLLMSMNIDILWTRYC